MTTTQAPPTDTGAGADDDVRWEAAWPLGFWRTVVLIVAIAFLAGVIGWRIGQPSKGSFNQVDIGFLADMTTHHQGAVALSFAYLARQHDPVFTQIAQEIIVDQSLEINAFNNWLVDAGDDADRVVNDDIAMEWMGAPVAPKDMPGLATVADYDELAAASGVEADDLFTRLMINHHAAGIAMAKYAIEHGHEDKVRNIAERIVRNQRYEIAEINARRAKLGLTTVTPETTIHTHG